MTLEQVKENLKSLYKLRFVVLFLMAGTSCLDFIGLTKNVGLGFVVSFSLIFIFGVAGILNKKL